MSVRIRNDANLAHLRKLTQTQGAVIYKELRRKVIKEGILDRSYIFYLVLSSVDIFAFFFFVYLFMVQKNPFFVLLSIAGIALFAVRIGGLIHDTGHRAIFNSAFLNDVFGYFCSFLVAFPYSVWKYKHNAHHAHPNEEGEDPDLEVPISFTEDMFKRRGVVVKLIRKHQAFLYYLVGPLVSYTMRLKALRFYIKNLNLKIAMEMSLMISGLFVWYVLPFLVFPFWKGLMFLLLVNEFAGFYMLNIFAPNHKGMPQLEKGTKFSFLEHQVMTSRNLRPSWLTDYIYLGLNYQIEHHLFPNCPRNKLGKITPFVREVCKKYNLAYMQTGIIESNRLILSELNKVSKTR